MAVMLTCGTVLQDPGLRVAEAEWRARLWEARAREDARARDQIIRRIDAARRALYEANLRTEQAEARAQQAEVCAGDAEGRAQQSEVRAVAAVAHSRQAEALARQLELRAQQAEARAQHAENAVVLAVRQREQALNELRAVGQERDALLSSTLWRATAPLRILGCHLPPGLRRVLRLSAKLGWWALTLKLPRKLREHV